MEWTDDAVVLGVRKHGETSVIVELLTQHRGRHLGLVQGGRSRTMRPLLQPGNSVRAIWRSRLEEHLGQFRLEGKNFRAAQLMEQAHGIYALQTLSSHLRLLPERDAQPALYEAFTVVLDNLSDPLIAGELVVRMELALLEELGFGLDLSCCAATGQVRDLIYVSPKSGRAVSGEAGRPYSDKMLPLPQFLHTRSMGDVKASPIEDILDGFSLTGFFFNRHVYDARGIEVPSERESLIRAITRKGETEHPDQQNQWKY